ncbi:hydroxyisourate hydrolase [Chryseobacterium sp. CFS15]|uniref:hydroxyisourate hydrolase n=1 Tax=Chryseobacterium sp. CFS15 TaxID=2986946 RepID=UPI002806A476|nr:hydroxyisourate hydrolase [Chryseobacterium sp. CFS15]MDQ8143291.1 hydroxyisourate hydrolase [Chryseobacterium sp. CFS15]
MKKFIFTTLFTLLSIVTFAQKNTFQLSSHILDVSKGLPAAGVKIKLEKYNDQTKTWSFVDEKNTDANGRIGDFLPSEKNNLGTYKLTFYTSDYFKKSNTESFYPFIEVVFIIKDKNHYHVPITLSAYGYSTYRGN